MCLCHAEIVLNSASGPLKRSFQILTRTRQYRRPPPAAAKALYLIATSRISPSSTWPVTMPLPRMRPLFLCSCPSQTLSWVKETEEGKREARELVGISKRTTCIAFLVHFQVRGTLRIGEDVKFALRILSNTWWIKLSDAPFESLLLPNR